MTPDFDYSEVPFGFNYCLNKSCKQASTCLRYRLYTHIPAACQTIRIINPVYAATIDDVCPFFMPDKKVRYALGITHLLDHVPYSDAVSIKRQMLAHFKQALIIVAAAKNGCSILPNRNTSVNYLSVKVSKNYRYMMNT